MKVLAEPSVPTRECPNPERWHAFDDTSAEIEVLLFWAQIVKTLKPKLVVETGSYRGLSTFYMARALAENGFGRIVTFEVVPEFHEATKTLVQAKHLADYVDARLESSLKASIDEEIDILLLDSDPALRREELDYFWDRLSSRGIIMFHDVCSNEWHNPLRQVVLELDRIGTLSAVFLSTPRGLAICQKRKGRL